MPIRPRRNVISLAIAPRPVLVKLLAVLSFVGCLALVISAHGDNNKTQQTIAGAAMDAVAPILETINSPVQSAKKIYADTAALFFLYHDNVSLRQENDELRKWQQLANRLEAENQSLRLLLGASSRLEQHHIAARVIHEGVGMHSQSGIIDAGSESGIRRGQAAIDRNGVVGRVTDTGSRSARLLYITAPNSNIPVMTEDSSQAGILSGRGDGSLPLLRYSNVSDIKQGERIITSGAGGMFPPGLTVGVIETITTDGAITVRPAANISSLDYVTVVESPAVVPPGSDNSK